MKILDGTKIARQINKQTRRFIIAKKLKPSLVIVHFGTQKPNKIFIQRKREAAATMGIKTIVVSLPIKMAHAKVEQKLHELLREYPEAGIVVQLPVPKQINLKELVKIIPAHRDVDGLRYAFNSRLRYVFKPAIIDAIILAYNNAKQKKGTVVLVGYKGALVGRPMARYFRSIGQKWRGVEVKTHNQSSILRSADVIISGVGQKCLFGPHDVKHGVSVIDAGFVISAGKIYGDFDRAGYKKTRYVTPVPGGLGPLTVAYLLRNTVIGASLAIE